MEVVKAPDNSREEKLVRLIEDYQKPMLDLCYMYLRDRELAEDAVQETFLKAYKALGTFRGESRVRTWLTRIAINTCRDMRRSAWFAHVNREVTPEDLNCAVMENFNQDAMDLANAIMRLPDKEKEVILLHYFQAMPMSEIAAVTGVTTSMVSRRVKKAHAKLYGMLGKEYLYG